MSLESKHEQYIENLVDKLTTGSKGEIQQVGDYLLFGLYGPSVFSQFGLGLVGFVCRQRPGSVLLTVKVTESGVPLVAFVTSATTMGCIEQMFDLLWAGRLKWQKDKFPWN